MPQRCRRLMAAVSVAIAFPCIMLADRSGTATLAANSFLNLDTGAASGKGSDILWDGSALIPQGRAGLYNLGKYGLRTFKAIPARYASAAPYGSTPIPAGALVAGDVFGVRTNGGRYAKVIVTEESGGTLSISYTTFGVTNNSDGAVPAAGPAGPTINLVQNNYSYILPGLPNYGIAPGSLFLIIGANLSSAAAPVLQSSAAPGLPTTLNQTSVSVTVNGVTTMPALYYTSATQVAAVLPSTTPVGKGTITIAYNGQTSAPAPIQVVANAVGLDTLYGTGNGAGVVTDNNGAAFGLTNSATPGQTVILWGSGIGADTSSDDRTYPQNLNNLSSVPTQVFIGGISANVLYRGRSQYPGLDQYNVVIPSGVSPGCFVSVILTTGSTGAIVSNSITIPVNPGGGPCSDPGTGLNGTQIQSLANKTNVKSAAISIVQVTERNGNVSSSAFLLASTMAGANFGKGYEYVSQGSCAVIPPEQGQIQNVFQAPLDAGAVQLTGPAGSMSLGPAGPGIYQATLGSGAAAAGTYTFAGSGGTDVGNFRVSLNLQGPLSLTNKAALASVTRSQGATVTWSGGFANGDVQIEGELGDQYGTVRFYCHAPSNAGQFSIPSSILMALPAGSGDLIVTNTTAPQSVTATGIDVGLAGVQVTVDLSTTFK